MSDIGPEQERLIDRLFNDPTRKTLNFHVTHGDGSFTAEELCAQINSAMDQVERRREAGDLGDEPPMSGRHRVDLRGLVDGLK